MSKACYTDFGKKLVCLRLWVGFVGVGPYR